VFVKIKTGNKQLIIVVVSQAVNYNMNHSALWKIQT